MTTNSSSRAGALPSDFTPQLVTTSYSNDDFGKDPKQPLYTPYTTSSVEDGQHDSVNEVELTPSHSLHKGLKARHISMIAIGGSIGTGLIIGSGAALARAGPASILIAYLLMGFLMFLVLSCVGEMASYIPLPAGFAGYADRYSHPSLGFALGWCYLCKYLIVVPNQLTAGALVIQYWVDADRVNPGVFITIFLVVIISLNYFGIKLFGELEFWLSCLKIITLVGVILLSLILALGGGPDHDRKGFRYWKNPGAFNEYLVSGATGRFAAFWSSITTALFAYIGTELIGVTVAEAQNPRKTIPRAIRLTFYRIAFFYCFSVFLVGMLVPYNSDDLAFANKATTGANASPFVVAIKLAGIQGLPSVLNAAICVFVFSAANSDLYIASRTLYGLAVAGDAPRIFSRTDNRGVPIYALGVSSAFALLAFMNVKKDTKVVFNYLVNVVTLFGLITWLCIMVAHIGFVKARKAQGIPDSSMPYIAPFKIYGSYIGVIFGSVVAFTKNFNIFVIEAGDSFDYKSFITSYVAMPVFLGLLFGHMYIKKTRPVRPKDADLYTGKEAVDKDEQAIIAHELALKEARKNSPMTLGSFYKNFVSWLF